MYWHRALTASSRSISSLGSVSVGRQRKNISCRWAIEHRKSRKSVISVGVSSIARWCCGSTSSYSHTRGTERLISNDAADSSETRRNAAPRRERKAATRTFVSRIICGFMGV